jgi:hypothetical protein
VLPGRMDTTTEIVVTVASLSIMHPPACGFLSSRSHKKNRVCHTATYHLASILFAVAV